ncbi:unnamed protein product, partial [Prorocentrum cordatum]
EQVRRSASRRLAELRAAAAATPPAPEGAPRLPLRAAHGVLTEGLVERSVEAKLLLLGIVGAEHVLLVGPPGTAKSLLSRRLSRACGGAYFERLLTRFTVPEEVLGPLSLKALERDELRRKVKGFLPAAEVAFLDEVFKANSAILNALLTLLNERAFDNGDAREQTPLQCVVAASNELPETDELDALYDRFLLRREVRHMSQAAVPDFLQRLLGPQTTAAATSEGTPPLLAAAGLRAVRAAAAGVAFPERLQRQVAGLREHLRALDPPVAISDRRMAQACLLVRAAACAVGATSVLEFDLWLLRFISGRPRAGGRGGDVAAAALHRGPRPRHRAGEVHAGVCEGEDRHGHGGRDDQASGGDTGEAAHLAARDAR